MPFGAAALPTAAVATFAPPRAPSAQAIGGLFGAAPSVMRDSVARNAPAPSPAPSRSFGFGSQAMQQDIGSATGGDFALAFQRESESMSSFSYAADSCQIDPCFTGEMADDWQPSSSVDTSHFDGFTYQPGTNSILPSLLSLRFLLILECSCDGGETEARKWWCLLWRRRRWRR